MLYSSVKGSMKCYAFVMPLKNLGEERSIYDQQNWYSDLVVYAFE